MNARDDSLHERAQNGRGRWPTDWAAAEGRPFPMGATWVPAERAYNSARPTLFDNTNLMPLSTNYTLGVYTTRLFRSSQEGRGTYAGIIEKMPYLMDLGITIVE